MKDTKDWRLLARYLADECLPAERERVAAWIRSDPAHEELIRSLKTLWDSPEAPLSLTPPDELWRKTAARAGVGAREQNKRGFRFWRLLPYAAVLLAAVVIPLTVWQFTRSPSPDSSIPELTKIMVEHGEQMDLTLSDGTRVTLDAGSSFEYPQKFTVRSREVHLEGEALFDVPADPDRPFLIHAHEALVQVVGTRFNVRAWDENEKVEVAVSEGRVTLRSEKDSPHNAVLVAEGQMSFLSEGEPPADPRSVDMKKYLGWLNKEADFQDVPFGQILFQLERWYDLRFVLRDSSITEERLTVFIENRPLGEILTLLAALTEQEFELRGNMVIFRPHD
jgi:ferric-dicitrate binding protein FerR (iron transport regulator)